MFSKYNNFNNYRGRDEGCEDCPKRAKPASADFGNAPFVVDVAKAARHNDYFRTALWTGTRLQLTLMAIPVGGDVGLEVHEGTDQFLFVAQGSGLAQMGEAKERLTLNQPVFEGCAVFVPAGTWHNITNTGNNTLKLFTLYAPPEHPHGTVQRTQAEAEAEEGAPCAQ